MAELNRIKNIYHDLSVDHIFKLLETGKDGLSEEAAASRLGIFGKNVLPKGKPSTALMLFAGQFKNPLAYVLLFAMALSFVMEHYSDGAIIALVVFVSGVVGFIQEYKASKALSELNSIVTFKARVLRRGVLSIVDQTDIVPGDIVDICPGDIIPADARLFASYNLRISDSVLTGEPVPSKKFIDILPLETSLADRDNMVFQGTAVSEGTGRAVVVATGINTEIGKIASLLEDTDEAITPLQKQIGSFGKWLSIFLLAVNVVIFIFGLLLGRPFYEMFMVSVVVVVSAVPEGLAPAMSIVLALGMQRLIRKKGLVRKIISAETLGAVSVICSDKTGTLTDGEMSVKSIITDSQIIEINKNHSVKDLNYSSEIALKICVISNDAVFEAKEELGGSMRVAGNTTDKSMLIAGSYYGYKREDLERKEKRLHELPFSSETKLMATMHEYSVDENIIYAKGAPEKILPLAIKILRGNEECVFNKNDFENINKLIAGMTAQGQRVVALAYKQTTDKTLSLKDLSGLVYVGLVVIKDQVREDVRLAIDLCHKAGVKVVMITGDHANTALAIANDVGIKVTPEQIISGNEIDDLEEAELAIRIKTALVYARVEPRHKLRIVSHLQKNGEIVAMTGDGVNDAPALKKADIGIVMGNGTDVAKEVADLVLLDNNFMTIVEAIRQGRTTFSNIRKVVVYLFTDCFQEMVVVGASVLVGWPLPILPVQILWIKLIESPLPATSLSFEESNRDVLLDRPRGRREQLLTGRLKFNIAFYSFIMDIIALSVFYYYWQSTGNIDKARTLIFVALGMSTLFNVYNIRSLGKSVFKVNPFKNKFLVIATIVGFLLFLLAVYSKFMNGILQTVPLGAYDWVVIFLYAFASLFVFETGKRIVKYRV